MKFQTLMMALFCLCLIACETTYQTPQNYVATQTRLDEIATPILESWQKHCGKKIGGLKPKSSKCDYEISLRDDNVINAYASGEKIIVTKGMMLSVDDLTLSLIIAHELGHNVLGHIDLDRAESRELEADRWAMYLLALAKLDYEKAGLDTASFRVPQNSVTEERDDDKDSVKKQLSKEDVAAREKRRANHFRAVIKEIKTTKTTP